MAVVLGKADAMSDCFFLLDSILVVVFFFFSKIV